MEEFKDRLIRFQTRFRPETFSKIQQLEKQTGKSKAAVIRRLVRASLRNLDWRSEESQDKSEIGAAVGENLE